jgi:hypothetical protein
MLQAWVGSEIGAGQPGNLSPSHHITPYQGNSILAGQETTLHVTIPSNYYYVQ